MIYKAANIIASHLASKNYIPEEDQEMISYGLFLTLSRFLYATESFFLGLILGCVKESLVFFVAFLFIRRYAGGAHAKTERRCFMLSSLSIACAVFIFFFLKRFININHILVSTFFLIATIIIFILCPVESEEKKIDIKDKKKYKIKASIRMGILIVLSFIFHCMNFHTVEVAVEVAAILASILLILGKIKEEKTHHT